MTSNSSSLKLIETKHVQEIKHYCMCMSISKIWASNPTVMLLGNVVEGELYFNCCVTGLEKQHFIVKKWFLLVGPTNFNCCTAGLEKQHFVVISS